MGCGSSFFCDPTVLFTFGVVLVPIAFDLDKPELIKEYLLNPIFLACLALIGALEIGAFFCTKSIDKKQRLTVGEYQTSRWYLMNGAIYHLLMDPFCGFMQGWSLMTKQYGILDERFAHPYASGSEAATLTVWLEGAVMCPAAIAVFIGYRYWLPHLKGKANEQHKVVWIYCLEFIVLLCESLGTYFFYGAECILLLTQQDTNMPHAKKSEKFRF
mmetsp:Transcript_58222/g.96532  ORF Transcript_58222/g.96532 Transcript_58222/m.96532 type:complete len:215 (+) Transcript_58222:30-674(+)